MLQQDVPRVWIRPFSWNCWTSTPRPSAEVHAHLLWAFRQSGPRADDRALPGLLGASAQRAKARAQGTGHKSPRHFFRDMVKSTRSISAALAGTVMQGFVQQRHSPVTVRLHLGFGVGHPRPFEDEVPMMRCASAGVVFAPLDAPDQRPARCKRAEGLQGVDQMEGSFCALSRLLRWAFRSQPRAQSRAGHP